MKFFNNLAAYICFLVSVISVANADAFDSILDALGLESFTGAISTSEADFPSLPSGICGSSIITGQDSLGNFEATGYIRLISSDIVAGIVQEYTYQLYWFFTYETPINADGFNFYGSSFQDGAVYYDAQVGAVFLTYQSTIDVLVIPSCTFFEPDNWGFDFTKTSSLFVQENYLVLLAGSNPITGQVSPYGVAETECAALMVADPINYLSCTPIQNNICLLNYLDACLSPPVPTTSTFTSVLSIDGLCTIEAIDVVIETVITETVVTTTESYVSTSTNWVAGLPVGVFPVNVVTTYTATVPAYISTTVTSVLTTTTTCTVAPSSSVESSSSSTSSSAVSSSATSSSAITSSSAATSSSAITSSSVATSSSAAASSATTSSTAASSSSSTVETSSSVAAPTSSSAAATTPSSAAATSSSTAAASSTAAETSSSVVDTTSTSPLPSSTSTFSSVVSGSTTSYEYVYVTTYINDCSAFSESETTTETPV